MDAILSKYEALTRFGNAVRNGGSNPSQNIKRRCISSATLETMHGEICQNTTHAQRRHISQTSFRAQRVVFKVVLLLLKRCRVPDLMRTANGRDLAMVLWMRCCRRQKLSIDLASL